MREPGQSTGGALAPEGGGTSLTGRRLGVSSEVSPTLRKKCKEADWSHRDSETFCSALMPRYLKQLNCK